MLCPCLQLKQAIVAVEAMEPSVKQELLAQICDREVAAYSQIYAMAGGVGGKLENVGKRVEFIRCVSRKARCKLRAKWT